MMAGSSAPGSKPGWVYDASSGYYHDPSTGVYFDQQRGAYHAHGRWLSHAEYTATYSKSVAAPQHVVHPSLSRGGVGESHPVGGSSNLVHAPPGAAAPPVSTGGWGTSMPAYGANAVGASSDVSTASADGMTRRRGASHHTQQPTPSFQPPASAPLRPTPLGLAAERGDVPEVNRLIREGADPDAPGPLGNRPLHYAAYEGHGRVVELLLAGGRGDPNSRNNTGVTPTHNAASRGHLECLASLISAGADVNAVDVDAVSPLHLATERRAIEALLRAGADPNARRRDGRTPLHEAAERGDGWATEAILSAGSNPNARETVRGRAPIHATSDWRCARALAAAGADLEAVADGDGFTPLQCAAAEGRAEVVSQLLEAGADPRARTPGGLGGVVRGKSAADLAAEFGHPDVVRLLADAKGARTNKGVNERAAGWKASRGGNGNHPRASASGVRATSRAATAMAILACVLVVAGVLLAGGVWGMQRELREWRELRAKKAARREARDAAAAKKKRDEEDAARRRAEASDAEVRRILACPARVTEEASKAAEAAKAAGQSKPRKDISAAHRCALGLGVYADAGGATSPPGGASPSGSSSPSGACAVCDGFLSAVAERLKMEMGGRGGGDAAATAADRLLGAACAEAYDAGDSRRAKLCDSLLAARREVARPMGLGVPPAKVCERAARKDPIVCEIKPPKEGDATDDGEGDAAAADAFKRLSLLVHPDKHRGKHAADAATAFRALKAARDHFDLLAKRAAEKRRREEGETR